MRTDPAIGPGGVPPDPIATSEGQVTMRPGSVTEGELVVRAQRRGPPCRWAGVDRTVEAPVADAAAPEGRVTMLRWRDDRTGLIIGSAMALVLLALGYQRYANRHSAIDLALFDQAMWLMSKGRAPELTVLPENLFGDHFSPAILVLVPLYLVAATPVWLIAAQAIGLGLSVPALRGLARQLGADERLATVATVLSSPLLAAALFDVHPIVVTVPVTAAAIAAALRDDTRAVTICAVLIVLLRADASILLLGVAVLAAPRSRRRLLVIAPIGIAIGVLVPMLLHSEQTFTRYWGHLGDGPVDAVTHPWRLVPAVFSGSVVTTAAIWLLPVGFLALGRARWAAATAVAGLPILVSSATATSLPVFHHAATYVPFTIGGALVVLADRRRVWDRPLTLGVGLALALALNSPLAPEAPTDLSIPGVLTLRSVADAPAALDRVGPSESVATEAYLLAHVSRRERVYAIEDLLDADDPRAALAPVEVVVAEVEKTDDLSDLGWTVEPIGPDLVIARR